MIDDLDRDTYASDGIAHNDLCSSAVDSSRNAAGLPRSYRIQLDLVQRLGLPPGNGLTVTDEGISPKRGLPVDYMPAAAGQELVWQRTWRRFGLTDGEVLAHFGGPAFLAWTRMGNVHSYMGPLPQSFVCDQAGVDRA